ncbi:MAG: DUF5118 domain-containing protein, partial [Gemmatimonadaceae bacterium]
MKRELRQFDRVLLLSAIAIAGLGASPVQAQDTAATTGRGGGGGGAQPAAPRPYARVVTDDAVTKTGLFKVHKIGPRLYFEIPRSELRKEFLVAQRTQAGTGGGNQNRVVTFEREGNRVMLRQQSHAVRADSSTAIYEAVSAMNLAPI